MADPFVAEIRIIPFNFAPKGWAFCDGQLLPISQNTALFSLLGTNYGGDGKNNFRLPDLRARSPMQPGQGPGLSMHDIGEQGGQAVVTLLPSEMPAHTHTLQASQTPPEEDGQGTPSPLKLLAPSTAAVYGDPGDAVALAAEAISPAGGGQPHQNRQPFLTLNFVIALQGVFPPRG